MYGSNLDSRDAVRQRVGELLRGKGDRGPFEDDESLIVGGRLSSVDVLHVVNFLEERFGADFSQGFDQGDLDTIDDILALIATTGG